VSTTSDCRTIRQLIEAKTPVTIYADGRTLGGVYIVNMTTDGLLVEDRERYYNKVRRHIVRSYAYLSWDNAL